MRVLLSFLSAPVAASLHSVDGVCLLQSLGFLERRKVSDSTRKVESSSADDLLYLAEAAERQEQAELDHIDDLLRGVDEDGVDRDPVDTDSLLRTLEEQAEESDADLLRRSLHKRMKSREDEEDDSRKLLREVLAAVDNSPREAHLGDRHVAELLRALRDHGAAESKPHLSQRRLDELARALETRDARERPVNLGRDTLQQLLESLRGDHSREPRDVQELDEILHPQPAGEREQSKEDRLLQASVAVAEAAARGEQAALDELDRLSARASAPVPHGCSASFLECPSDRVGTRQGHDLLISEAHLLREDIPQVLRRCRRPTAERGLGVGEPSVAAEALT
mmetsp:Transcript_43372/g.114429  ORF Transcript_43372/g.114429 Transcript_43372/m.114429 type:complete len:338 (+) Transcript_43372:104-1117(+)